MNQVVVNGNNIEVLKSYPDNYFDSVVTDPPYGLGKEPNAAELMKDWVEHGYHEISGKGFMGKEWDAFVPQPIFWKEVFRVLKHGGHVVSFFGTRTYDWGVMAMRFAGFEVRDCIQWLYGSGFPKSHNISKAIDKMPKASSRLCEFAELLNKKRIELGLSITEADDLICGGSTMYNFLEGRNTNGVLKIYPPNKEFYERIKSEYKIEGWDDIVENNLKTIGSEKGNFGFQTNGERWSENRDIKSTTTEQAKQWEGWGTALKPANEPIVLARKPLEKGLSVAENILKWGTGGINIDASRVGNETRTTPIFSKDAKSDNTTFNLNSNIQHHREETNQGRFPANLILTHHPECECKGTKKVKGSNCSPDDIGKGRDGDYSNGIYGEKSSKVTVSHTDDEGMETVEDWDCHDDCPIKVLNEQSGVLKTGAMKKSYEYVNNGFSIGKPSGSTKQIYEANEGGASRFFYCAKASKSERNKGLDGFEEKENKHSTYGIHSEEGIINNGRNPENRTRAMSNFHPTVKPIKLMQYLVKLVTPPNGLVLDPFCGSGTTGVACTLDGFRFVGIEQDPEYTKIAEARINANKGEQIKESEPKSDKQEPIQTSLF